MTYKRIKYCAYWNSLVTAFRSAVYSNIVCLGLAPAAFATEVVVEFSDDQTVEESQLTGVERIFRNPALASGFASGAESLNRSIDSLMEGLFYSLMDNELVYDVTDASQFKAFVKRDVYESADGMHVVVDRFGIGPSTSAPVTTFYGLPINLGVDGSINVLNINLRSDGQRYVEQEELPWWRHWVNNWFGLLPPLTRALPPSFNPHELYDPIGELSTPFVFPTSVAKAMSMPIGNLRAYSVSAILHLGTDLLAKKEHLKLEGLNESVESLLPYKIFREGEHRINVLRRDQNRFWVGVSTVDRYGHQLEGRVAKIYYLFDRVVSLWKGMPAIIAPIRIEYSGAQVQRYDMVFEFDLSNRNSHYPFERAVLGDFSLAQELAMKGGFEHGVGFQFSRSAVGKEFHSSVGRNTFVERQLRDRFNAVSEITTEDSTGRFQILEIKQQTEDQGWDVLVGSERITYENRATIRVKKNSEGVFEFDTTTPDPIGISLGLSISDKYVDTLDYRSYLSLIRNFSGFDLRELPDIPIRDRQEVDSNRAKMFFVNPLDQTKQINETPTHLGTIEINASAMISHALLQNILQNDEAAIVTAYCNAFGFGNSCNSIFNPSKVVERSFREIVGFIFEPLALLNVRHPNIDFVSEIQRGKAALKSMKLAKSPHEFVLQFEKLLDTKFPANVAKTLILLSKSDVPRDVVFRSKSKGEAGSKSKELFKSLDGRKLSSKVELIHENRYNNILDGLARFNPRAMREWRQRPSISSIRLSKTEISPSESSLNVSLTSPHINDQRLKIFLRLEQAGRINVGRFVLFEGIVESQLMSSVLDGPIQLEKYEFELLGDRGVADNFAVEQAFNLGGDFTLILTVSYDGVTWSQDREIAFGYAEGQLFKKKTL